MAKVQNEKDIRRRHSGSHIMTAAVRMMFPNIKMGVGPWTDDGFYQDFDFGEEKISDSEFKEIEKKMRWIVNKNFPIRRYETDYKTAKKLFAHDPFKLELIEDLKKDGEKVFSFYDFGEQEKPFYRDLCAGPHLNSTGELGAFKLMKLAGAYWRGDEKNQMLTRIYGTAFDTKEELDEYLYQIEEAKKRDHRVLGKQLGLYTIDPEVGLGLPLWKPNGATMLMVIKRWFEDHQLRRGYIPVMTPHIGRKALWEMSGHWGFYNNSMYPPIELGQTLADYQDKRKPDENEIYLLKPMNCPFHIKIYTSDPHSYRDFPLRYYEFGTVYRFEQKGELGGLTRVRGFTQDDAHIMCRRDQLAKEFGDVIDFGKFVLEETFGFTINMYASFRDPKKKEKYLGKDKDWEIAEKTIVDILNKKKIPFVLDIGEAAFYGPKVDFKVKDSLGREWQLSTVQFDFNLPARFEMKYVNEKGEEEQPFMIHRALLGSLERFAAILIEHYAGAFPFWFAPVQVAILPVAAIHESYGEEVEKKLREKLIRIDRYDTRDSLDKRIRDSQMRKIPYTVIVGNKEKDENTVTIRKYGEEKQKVMKLEDFLAQLESERK